MLMIAFTTIKFTKAYIFVHSNKLDCHSECEHNSKRLANLPDAEPAIHCLRTSPS